MTLVVLKKCWVGKRRQSREDKRIPESNALYLFTIYLSGHFEGKPYYYVRKMTIVLSPGTSPTGPVNGTLKRPITAGPVKHLLCLVLPGGKYLLIRESENSSQHDIGQKSMITATPLAHLEQGKQPFFS